MQNNHGFTLIEMLLALLIISFAIALLPPCLSIVKQLLKDERFTDDRIAIHQLRQITAMSSEYLMQNQKVILQRGDEGLFFQFPVGDFADEGLWQHRSKFQLLVNRVLRNMLLTIC